MDIESLVSDSSNGKSVSNEIFLSALAPEKWGYCDIPNGRCPFCENAKMLLKGELFTNVIKYLRYYELASCKRWTFREIFSLVSHIMVGDDELVHDGKAQEPCLWARKQLELAQQSSARTAAAAGRAPFALCSRLFHHRLFPRWPRLNFGQFRVARTLLSRPGASIGDQYARDFFGWLDRAGHTKSVHGDDVHSILSSSFGETLDPALAQSDCKLFEKDGTNVVVRDIDEAFSLSVEAGFQLVNSRIHPLERDVLKRMSMADEALFEENVPRIRIQEAQLLQSTIRHFCCNLAKRSIGCRAGVCRDLEMFESFDKARNNSSQLRDVRRQLQDLLRDGHRSLVSLVTTFGQPNANKSRRVELSSAEIKVKDVQIAVTNSRPLPPMPFLRIDRRPVAVTFQLFKAMERASQGLYTDCLGEELFALLDSVRSMVAGERVRDFDILDDAEILIGETRTTIEYRDGQFFAQGAENVT